MIVSSQLSLFLAKDPAESWVVRESRRARRLSVRVYPAGRVEVVVPLRTSAALVQQFVSKHRVWIDERLRDCQPAASLDTLPHALELRGIEQHVRIEFIRGSGMPRVRVMAHGANEADGVGVVGDPGASRDWSRALCRWLMRHAQDEIERRLNALAAEYDLQYRHVRLRRQRTRWGSCSSRGAININVCALFLAPEVLRYLLVHEICHTRHMNHSKRFWSLVEKLEPDFARLDRELRSGWRHVPAWMFLN